MEIRRILKKLFKKAEEKAKADINNLSVSLKAFDTSWVEDRL